MIKNLANPIDFLILVVDDQPANLKVLQGILQPLGYGLTFATSGTQALQRVKTAKPDLILLDLMMPELDGLEVCKRLKNDPEHSNIPVIFLTANQQLDNLVHAFEEGAVDYVMKPFNISELLSRIKNHINIKYYYEQLQQQAEQERLINHITKSILAGVDWLEILHNTVTQLRSLLAVERIAVCEFNKPSNGIIVAESVNTNYPALLGMKLENLPFFFQEAKLCEHQKNNLSALSVEQINFFNQAQVKSELILPIYQVEDIWGFILVHKCEIAIRFSTYNINLLTQVAEQLSIALQHNQLYQQLQAANRELARIAATDSLTQIANRRQFDVHLNQQWQMATASRRSLSLILCDVDYFKEYNDFYGHPAGDEVLIKVAKALVSCLDKPMELVARYGGEEFTIILPNTTTKEAIEIANSIQMAIASLEISHKFSKCNAYLTLSMGIATMLPNKNQKNSYQIVTRADKALYQAKSNGRNRYHVFSRKK